LSEVPAYLAQMALLTVNTGCRDQKVCSLRWEWELATPQLETSVFIIPGTFVKNGDERLVVLNRIAKSVVEARGISPTHVFTYKGKLITRRMTAWKRARIRAKLPQVRVHDLKHTFGSTLASSRGELRGSARSARTSLHADHHALLGCVATVDRGGEPRVRTQHEADRVGRSPRIDPVESRKIPQALTIAVAENYEHPKGPSFFNIEDSEMART
jgi:integrase-like protein